MTSDERIEEIINILYDLETDLQGELTDDETRGEILDEIALLEDELEELKRERGKQ